VEQEQIQYVALDKIAPDPLQPRRDFGKQPLDELVASLKEVGQLVPIRIRLDGERFVLVDGERRWRAAKVAGLAAIAAIVESKALDAGQLVQRQLVANCQREGLTAMEEAQAVSRLMEETGWTASQVAARLGKSPATISRLLSLLGLPHEVRERVATGEIAASAAYAISRIDDPEKQREFAEKAAGKLLSRDALAGLTRRRAPAEGARPSGRVCCRLPGGSTVTVAGSELDLEAFINLLEEVLKEARRARTQGLAVSTLAKVFRDRATA
jgi:ParB family chromosome partitioning protein